MDIKPPLDDIDILQVQPRGLSDAQAGGVEKAEESVEGHPPQRPRWPKGARGRQKGSYLVFRKDVGDTKRFLALRPDRLKLGDITFWRQLT